MCVRKIFKSVCVNTVRSPFFIFFVDLVLIVENLDVVIKIRMLGRVFVTQFWLAVEICLN